MRVVGRREFPCGPHYDRKEKLIVNPVRFSPHLGVYYKSCPTCGRSWRVVIQPGEYTGSLVATWELKEVGFIADIPSDHKRRGERNVLLENLEDDPEAVLPPRSKKFTRIIAN
jgi:hypothetical protein